MFRKLSVLVEGGDIERPELGQKPRGTMFVQYRLTHEEEEQAVRDGIRVATEGICCNFHRHTFVFGTIPCWRVASRASPQQPFRMLMRGLEHINTDDNSVIKPLWHLHLKQSSPKTCGFGFDVLSRAKPALHDFSRLCDL